MSKQILVLCGGSNGSHVLAADIGRREGWEVRLLTTRPQAWSGETVCTEHHALSDALPYLLPLRHERYAGRVRAFAWEHAQEALAGADLVALACPVHAHRALLERVLPALDPDHEVALGSLYAQGGFDWIVRDVVERQGLDLPRLTVFGLKRFPFLCKQADYGASVNLYGRFPKLVAAVESPDPSARQRTLGLLQELLRQPLIELPALLCCTFNLSNQVLHPGITWGLFHDYVAGTTVYERKKGFYSEVTALAGREMFDLALEMRQLALHLEQVCGVPLARWMGIEPITGAWLRFFDRFGERLRGYAWAHDRRDRIISTLFRHHKRLNPAMAPMLPGPGGEGWVPDFGSRFWEDDIGHGLCVLYGIGLCLDHDLPRIRSMVQRQQALMGRHFLEGSAFGPDLVHTNAPQVYGATDTPGLLELVRG